MSQRQKLIEAIRQNTKIVRFDDACKLASWLGFVHSGGQGSHRVFKRAGEPVQLHFQNCNGIIQQRPERFLLKKSQLLI